MYEQKTKADTGSVDDFLAQVEDPVKRADSQVLIELMQAVSGEPPVLWDTWWASATITTAIPPGTKVTRFSSASRHARPSSAIYLMGCYFPQQAERRDALLARLGKHRMGKACLYVKRLSDIDLGVLRELAEMSVRTLRETYPTTKQ